MTAQLYGHAAKQARIAARPLCKVEDCCTPVRVLSRGMCHKHYMRWRIHGDPHIVLPNGRHKAGPSPRTLEILRTCESYNASATEAAWILGVTRQTAGVWARRYGFVLRRDPPGQERFFSESRTHRAFVMRKFRG